MARREKRDGFTLIELLIVVAIIAILALIAVPNFLEAQVRAKVGRAKTDMRSIATAMEAYRVDWNAVPYYDSFHDALGDPVHVMDPGPLWWVLTSPVAYITAPFRDPFSNVGRRSEALSTTRGIVDPFIEVATGYLGPEDARAPRTHWNAACYGPDHGDDTETHGRYPYTGYAIPYDPTNGTVSVGDIYRSDGRPPTNFLSDLNMGNNTQGGFNPWW